MHRNVLFSFNSSIMCAVKIILIVATIFLRYEVACNLEQDVQPKSYKLKLVPFLENSFNFTGEVFIDILCTFSTTEILLYSTNLTIFHVQVLRNGQNFPSSYELLKKQDILHIKTQDYMAFDAIYTIHIGYQGYLNDEMIGFYRSSYKIGRQTKWLATTLFEPTFARMAFPCFDEPGHRTTFDISVARYKNQIALSNMPVKETSEEDPTINNRVWDTFQSTPAMPTYLVAVVVCDFVSTPSPDDRRISLWARKNAIKDATYSMHQSSLILDHLEVYTGIDFSLPKLDLIAIPDFKVSAMENWGLTTYRERNILHQNDTDNTKQKETVTLLIAHEFVHQWFGNLVTPEWWDYFWLSESFATYLKYKVTATIEPAWRIDEFFVTENLQNVLFVDEVNYHHALTTEVKTAAEIEDIFDLIIYQKGGSIMRMLERSIMSPLNFQKALRYYLEQGQPRGGVGKPENLWEAIDKEAPRNMNLPLLPSEITANWTTNRGYPLINVTRIVQNNCIIVEQTTYKSPRSSVQVPDQKWIVPLTFTTSRFFNFSSTKPSHWSGMNSSNTLQLDMFLQPNEWVLFNIQQTGYYRVIYDLNNWKLLVKQLHICLDNIHVLNRAQLIDDSFALAIDEKLSYDIPINLANYLANETDMIPWFAAIRNFNYLYAQYENTAINNTVRKYLTEIIDVQYRRVGFYENFNDEHLTKTGRTSIITLACYIGHPDCIAKTKKLYETIYANNLSKVPWYLKYPLYCSWLRYGNADIVWEKLWTIYKTTNFAYESEIILSTVGCTNDEKTIKNILTNIILEKDDDIRKQNKMIVLRSVYQTSNGVTATLNFIANLVSKQQELRSNTIAKIIPFIKKIRTHVNSEEQLKLLKRLITDMNQEDKKFVALISALKNAYQDGSIRVQMNLKRMEELKYSIENRLMYSSYIESTTPDVKQTDSSSITKLTPSWWFNVFLGIILFYLSVLPI